MKTKKEWIETFLIIVGGDEVPVDMLRYATSVPADEGAATNVRLRPVLLRRFSRDAALLPNVIARWESFGWKVVAHWGGEDLARDEMRHLAGLGDAGLVSYAAQHSLGRKFL